MLLWRKGSVDSCGLVSPSKRLSTRLTISKGSVLNPTKTSYIQSSIVVLYLVYLNSTSLYNQTLRNIIQMFSMTSPELMTGTRWSRCSGSGEGDEKSSGTSGIMSAIPLAFKLLFRSVMLVLNSVTASAVDRSMCSLLALRCSRGDSW